MTKFDWDRVNRENAGRERPQRGFERRYTPVPPIPEKTRHEDRKVDVAGGTKGSDSFITCPKCSAPLKATNLKRHLGKVHSDRSSINASNSNSPESAETKQNSTIPPNKGSAGSRHAGLRIRTNTLFSDLGKLARLFVKEMAVRDGEDINSGTVSLAFAQKIRDHFKPPH